MSHASTTALSVTPTSHEEFVEDLVFVADISPRQASRPGRVERADCRDVVIPKDTWHS